jgi:excisionase family DNA binding protein
MGTASASYRGMPKSFLVKDAAALLGVSRRTVYYRIRDGRLRTVRTIGGSQRVLLESIEALLREQRGLEFRDPGADASDTAPSAKCQAP